jgi:hypothetical protein
MKTQEKLLFISIGVILITILCLSLSHSKDEVNQEQKRRNEMYKYIGDEKGN